MDGPRALGSATPPHFPWTHTNRAGCCQSASPANPENPTLFRSTTSPANHRAFFPTCTSPYQGSTEFSSETVILTAELSLTTLPTFTQRWHCCLPVPHIVQSAQHCLDVVHCRGLALNPYNPFKIGMFFMMVESLSQTDKGYLPCVYMDDDWP